MERSQWYLGTPNGVVLCIDRMENGSPAGRFYHFYSRDGVPFSNMEEAVFELEQFFDSINFPHPTTSRRSFGAEKRMTDPGKERKKIMRDEELLSKHGDLGTFIVRVQHRQNSSWQGRVTWQDKDKTICFRSIWEMIKLLESALDTVSEQEGPGVEISWSDEG